VPIVDLSSPSVVGHGRSWKPKWLRHVAFTVYYFSFPAFLKIASEGTSSVSLRASIRVPSGPPQAGMQAPPQAGKQAGRQAGWQAFFLSDVTEAGIAPAQQAGRQADELENMATEAPGAEETVHRRYTMIMYGFWEIHTKTNLKTTTLKHVKRTRHQNNLKTTTLKHVKRTP
jgi:hypothetical protein